MKQILRAISTALLVLVLSPVFAQSVRDSLHNLSASGPGGVKAQTADRICVFCHIPHSAVPGSALWGRGNSSAAYIPYSSTTAVAQPGQPTGTSILCLSCHDGTVALGQVLNRGNPISMAGGQNRMPQGKGLQGTDLTDDHPISFEYSASLASQNGELESPGTISPVLRLDENGELQCTTCHDAHNSPFSKLLRLSNLGSQLCMECHAKAGWSQSSHNVSSATWSGRPPNPWVDNEYSTVRDNGCGNCHLSHNGGGSRLLKYSDEEENCSDCHNGNVATADVMQEIGKFSSHRVGDSTLIHDPAEPATVTTRHVECVDCHNPHATRAGRSPGDTPANVRGVNITGAAIDAANNVYEICLRCHGDSPNLPPARTPRQHDQANVRLKIQPTNPSYHPIAGVGANSDVPSLITPLTEQSIIGCTDCHNSNSARSIGGSGPEGPHGSVFEPLLVRNYVTADNTPESAANYALCYECHSRDSILGDESFREHDKHIRGEDTPCNACHEPHGVSNTQGNTTNNTNLINFDTSIVFPNNNGLLRFVDEGNQAGSCDLLCHGEDHDNFSY